MKAESLFYCPYVQMIVFHRKGHTISTRIDTLSDGSETVLGEHLDKIKSESDWYSINKGQKNEQRL